MTTRAYDAILLDIDGTLIDDGGGIRPRVRSSLHAAHEAGVHIVIATGRSVEGVDPIVEALGLEVPAIVYNGAGIYETAGRRLVEERLLSNRVTTAVLEHARERGYLLMMQQAGQKFLSEPRSEVERGAIENLECVEIRSAYDVPTEYVIRATLFSSEHRDSAEFHRELAGSIDHPLYWTHFPLSALADHRDSQLHVVDVQPPCKGKAEALRFLAERHDIPAARVVAVGDANNDIEMLTGAGLGVAMGNGMAVAREAADRIIGTNGTDAIADLVEEVFALR